MANFVSDKQRKHVMSLLRQGALNTWQRRMVVSAGIVGGIDAANAAKYGEKAEEKKLKRKLKIKSIKKPTVKSEELRLFAPQGNTIVVPAKPKTISATSGGDSKFSTDEKQWIEGVARRRANDMSETTLKERINFWGKGSDKHHFFEAYVRALEIKQAKKGTKKTPTPEEAKVFKTKQLSEQQIEKKLDIPENKIEEHKDGTLLINKKTYAEKSPEMLGSTWVDREGRQNDAMFVRLIKVPKSELPKETIEKQVLEGKAIVGKKDVFFAEKEDIKKLQPVLSSYERTFGKINGIAFILRTKYGAVSSPFLITDANGKGNFFKSDPKAHDVASASRLAKFLKTNVPLGEVIGDEEKEKPFLKKMYKSKLFAERRLQGIKEQAKREQFPVLMSEIIHPSKVYADLDDKEKRQLKPREIGKINAFEKWIGAGDRHNQNYLIKTDESKPYSIDQFFRYHLGDNAGRGDYEQIGRDGTERWDKAWKAGKNAMKKKIEKLSPEKIREAVKFPNKEFEEAQEQYLILARQKKESE